MMYLGLDTSNYTTSMAVAEDNSIIYNEKISLNVDKGRIGLRQNDAVFGHVRNIPELAKRIGQLQISAIGYAAYPRDADSSYMPCFTSGSSAARCMASLCGIPSYPFSHQAGHIAAAIYSAGADKIKEAPYLAFHVSGGTTELLYVKEGNIISAGRSMDLHAGQAVDRIGVMLGLAFPCGAELEKLAVNTAPGKPRICVKDLNCNLSGLENQAAAMIKKGYTPEETAAYTIEFIKLTIDAMTENALERYGPLPVLYAGGVMSNVIIKEHLMNKYDAYFGQPEYSCDNAAGIALLCRDAYNTEQILRIVKNEVLDA